MANDTLRATQVATLQRMLNLNADESGGVVWKALVMDLHSQAIVSLVLRVNDLLRCGVTVHLLLALHRAALPDVPCVYFVEPTAENIQGIVDDLENDRYALLHVNFTSALPRVLLEEFAKKVAATGRSARVAQVYDQYVDFVVTEPELFSLEMRQVYSQLNSPGADELVIDRIASSIADGLFNVVVLLGTIPVIRCPLGGPAEYVASKLDQRLRDHITNTSPVVSSRSLLVLLDRQFDLAAMFAHLWIYQCMVADVFTLERLTITVDGKKHDIDPHDFFWEKNAQLPFPDAVVNVETELEAYKKKAHAVTTATGVSDLLEIAGATDTLHIQSAIKQLPELTARKLVIDMHMNILAALLAVLEKHHLDQFFEVEQMVGGAKTQARFLELVRQEGPVEDKLRTYCMMVLGSSLPKEFLDEAEQLLQEQGADISVIRHLKRVKEIQSLAVLQVQIGHPEPLLVPSGTLSGLSSRLMGLAEGGLRGVGSLVLGLKNLLPANTNMPVTNIVSSLMDPQGSGSAYAHVTDDYVCFDPKVRRGGGTKPPRRVAYQEAVVFVIGGGNYLEYQNLQEWKAERRVVYGGTSMVSPKQFASECAALGK